MISENTVKGSASLTLPTHQQQQTMDVLFELSKLLNTGLDRETLGLLVALTENGAHPEALAMVVRELRREAAALARNAQGTVNSADQDKSAE